MLKLIIILIVIIIMLIIILITIVIVLKVMLIVMITIIIIKIIIGPRADPEEGGQGAMAPPPNRWIIMLHNMFKVGNCMKYEGPILFF